MNYFSLNSALKRNKMYLFSLRDMCNLFPGEKKKTLKNNLSRWLAKGYLRRLKRDLYEFIDAGQEVKISDLYVANKLYQPSYISLETALSIYSIIPEVAAAVTSVTTGFTRRFKNKYGSFFYRSCKPEAFSGYRLMLYDGFKVSIADKEKALVDFLYYRLRSGFALDFGQERFNRKILNKINWQKSFAYAKLFNKKTLMNLKKCREYIEC